MAKAKISNKQKTLNRNHYEDISNPKHRIVVKFNDLDKAKRYLRTEGFRYQQSYSYKEDRCMLYRKGKLWLKLASNFDYLNDSTTEMGTVWNIQTL